MLASIARIKLIVANILLKIPEKYDVKPMRKIREYRKQLNPFGTVGEGTYGMQNITVHSWNVKHKIQIGSYCSIADNVHIFLGGNHHMYRVTTFPFSNTSSKENIFGTGIDQFLSKGDVEIGHDVWIGSNVSIMSGVRIGSGSVIAAFSHVVRDVLPYEIVGGNPAKHIRFRFNDVVVNMLLKLAWWNWPVEKILENLDLLLNSPEENLQDLINLSNS